MNLIVDANIIFSSLIKDGKTIELLSHFSLNLYSPEFVLQEIEKHKTEILKKTKKTEKEFNDVFSFIKKIISIIPKEEFNGYIDSANKISPDPDDVMYIALALKLKYPIWSNDKDLKKQNIVKIYSTEELVKIV